MSSIWLIFVFILIPTNISIAKLQTFPKGYRYRDGHEAVYKFKANSQVSVFVVQMAASYDYDVIVTPGPEPRQLFMTIENLTYDDDLEEPTQEDITALQYPFIVTLGEEDIWTNLKLHPGETAYSADMKDTLLTLIVFNVTEIEEFDFEQNNNLDIEDTDIPLGKVCKVKQKFTDYADSFQLQFSAKRSDCTGDSDLKINGEEVTKDSNFVMKLTFEKQPLLYKKAEINIKMTVNASPSIKMRTNQSIEFTGFRLSQSRLNAAALTESYTPEEFNDYIEILKAAKQKEE